MHIFSVRTLTQAVKDVLEGECILHMQVRRELMPNLIAHAPYERLVAVFPSFVEVNG